MGTPGWMRTSRGKGSGGAGEAQFVAQRANLAIVGQQAFAAFDHIDQRAHRESKRTQPNNSRVEESGRPRESHKLEIVGSNPTFATSYSEMEQPGSS